MPNYSAITYKDIYPGVDATFRGDHGKLSYELHGTAEAVAQVQTAYVAGTVTRGGDGPCVVKTGLGDKVFQGMLPVGESGPVAPAISGSMSPASVTLAYSTYLAGSDNDYGEWIAVDNSGCAYIVGITASTIFPTENPYQTDQPSHDVFVTKLRATGDSLVYSTFLGGDDYDAGWGIAVDAAGDAFVTGYTVSINFPTQTPYQTNQLGADAFVTKLSPAGNSLLYSTYLGGSGDDFSFGIAVNSAGNAFITGWTASDNYPTQSPFQPNQLDWDVFVTKLTVAGNGLMYSTYLGGSSTELGSTIAIDAAGSAYVVGNTESINFPTKNPYQTNQDSTDAFVAKLSATGNSLVYSTYLGGTGIDEGYGIAVDDAGYAYVTGETSSINYPTKTPVQPNQAGEDVFVTKLAEAGDALVYSTYLGGSSDDYGFSIAVGSDGSAFAVGQTISNNFPTQLPFETYQSDYDAFVTRLSPGGNNFIYSTYLGGTASDYCAAVAVDGSDNAYVTGPTRSADYPIQSWYQKYRGLPGYTDAFVTKLAFAASCCVGTTGNVNMSGIVDVSDLSMLVSYLTASPPPTLPCPDEANINALSIVDVSDLSLLVAYLTQSPAPTLPNCP